MSPAMKNPDDERVYYSQIRREIDSLLPQNIKRTFEIGCGEGNTLAYLKESKACIWAGGVEVSSDAACRARDKLDMLIEGNIETVELPIESGSLDLILCLDVLEHLIDPWSAIKRLHLLLKPGGSIIASIPNVQNYRIVLPLLFKGEWRYTDSGLLDKTHLRFFTLESAIKLMENSGLCVDMIKETGLEEGSKAKIVNFLSFSLFKQIFAVQYLIRAVREK